MASAGGAKPWVVSMQSRPGGALACRPSCSCALLPRRAPSGLFQAASPSARFISILSFPRSRMPTNVIAIHAQDPDFYKIPYVEGIPVGKRLKLWNLPPNCKHSELLEWFAGIDVKVDSLEFTDDPVLNAQGIGGFVELATKQDACIAIVRLDGYKFRGHYIRLDFAEKRPHSRDYGRRNRSTRSSSSGNRGNSGTPSRSTVTDMVPSYDGSTSVNARSFPRYEAANSSVLAPSGYGSSTQSASAQSTSSHEAANLSTVEASSGHSSGTKSSDLPLDGAGNNKGIRSNSGYGNTQSPAGYGSTLPSAGYGAAQFPPGHGSAPSHGSALSSSSISGGSLSVPSTPPPSNIVPSSSNIAPSQSNIHSAPRYGASPENGDAVNKTTEYHPLPSVTGYGSPQSPPSYGSTPVSGSSLQQKDDSTFGSPQRPLSQSGTKLNGESATVPSSPSYDNRSGAPLHRNRNMQPLYSDGTVTGKSFKSGSGWAANNNNLQQGTANYGVDKPPPRSSYNSQALPSSYDSQRSSSASISNSQIPFVSSSMKSSPGSVSIPSQPSYGEAQPSARSSTPQAAPSPYKKSPIETVSNNAHAPVHSPVAQGPPPRPLNAPVQPYEDPFESYGVPNAAVLEPWLHNTSFRSGPMFGSPQPSSLNRLFVGNLAVSIDDASLHELFSKFGTVLEARVLRDQESRRSRGFAVVAMSSADEMKAASKALDGWRVESRPLRVDAVTFKP